MKKILIDDFEIERNDWGYYFTANIDFLGQNSELQTMTQKMRFLKLT